MVGGYVGHTALKTTEILKPGANAWVSGPVLLEPRSQLSGVTLNETVFVSGGLDENNNARDEVRLNEQL